MPGFATHLWQSTAVALIAYLLTLALRNNPARVRFKVWFAVSMKFLIPFAPLVALGTRVHWRSIQIMPGTRARWSIERIEWAFDPASSRPAITAPHASPIPVTTIIAAIWACGFILVIARWFIGWNRIRRIAKSGRPMSINAPVRTLSCPGPLEPGIFGIFRPVLLLPDGITDRLNPAELASVVAHEMCHVRRRDNLFAALHMLVEAVFWFHPLVWWIGSRLVEERERACDEDVVRRTSNARVYAESILRTCEFYLESPLACASGVTGADLKKRIVRIVSDCAPQRLGYAKRALLVSAASVAILTPVLAGVLLLPRLRAQQPVRDSFEVASIKPGDPLSRNRMIGFMPGGGLRAENISLKFLLRAAFQVQDFQIVGEPKWAGSDLFNIEAKPANARPGNFDKMSEAERKEYMQHFAARLQALLEDRFHLETHREERPLPVYDLIVAERGAKLTPAFPVNGEMRNSLHGGDGQLQGEGASIEMLVNLLSQYTGRTVVDRTGLAGQYDFKLAWTPDPPAGAGPQEATLSDSGGPSLSTTLEEQLGLKLQPAKRPVVVIVIDHVEQPSPN